MSQEAIKSDVVTAIVSTTIPEIVIEEKDNRRIKSKEYIPFGTDNLYPQALAALYRKSVPLRGIIDSKVSYVKAAGFQVDEKDLKGLEFIKKVNLKNQSLTTVYSRYLTDKFFSGNSYLEIVTNTKKDFLYIYHTQTVKCRLSNTGESVLIHPNWELYKKGDKLTKEIPLYPKFKSEGSIKRSMVHVTDYEPDFDYYGVPKYISALDSAAIGYKTNKWNVSRLDNSFQSSGVLVIDGQMSDDDAKALKTEFKKEMLGEGNQGKVLMIIKKLGGEGTEYTPINSNSEGDWIELHNQSNDDLIIANGWKKSLAGISESTGFDTKRILNDYQVMKSTFILDEQNNFIELIQGIAKDFNIDLSTLSIKNTPPISLLTELTADRFVKKWEARREAGLYYDEELQDDYVDTGEKTENKTTTAVKNALAVFKEKIGLK